MMELIVDICVLLIALVVLTIHFGGFTDDDE